MNSRIARQLNFTAAKIRAFADLQPGWHFGSGRGPSPEAISGALFLNGALVQSGIVNTNAFPGVSGEVQVSAYSGDSYIELIVNPDLSIDAHFEIGGVEVDSAEGLSLVHALAKIQIYRGKAWLSSGYYIRNTSTPSESALPVSRFDPQVTAQGFRSLTKIASGKVVQASANTSQDITVTSRDRRQYSGFSTQKNLETTVSSFRSEVQAETIAIAIS